MLDKLIAAMQHPDICILDIRMQEMDGYDLIAKIRRRCPLPPVSIYSRCS
jgi:CheY-like chemotaxis protein